MCGLRSYQYGRSGNIISHYVTKRRGLFRLPISAFFQKSYDRAEVPDMPVDTLQLWNSFSYYPSVHMFNYLTSQRGKYFGKDKKLYYGEYLFTIDWCHPESNILDCEHSEIPHEHKCGHIMALDNGNYAIQPNNRILWNISNFTTRDDIPDLKSKLQNGTSRIKAGLQKIRTKCSTK